MITFIAYFLGVFFPIKNIMPIIDENHNIFSKFEFHSLLVNWVLAVFTLFTILVALFKEEIIKFLKHPIIRVTNNSANMLNECLADVEQNRKISKEYSVVINIENNGNYEARNIDVLITKIIFFNTVANTEYEIPIDKKHVKVNEPDSLLLLPSMTCSALLFSLSKDSVAQTNTSIDNSDNYYILKIGENVIDKQYQKGELKIHFQAYCDGGFKDSKIIKIKWDGTWEDRLSDISPNHLCVEEVNDNE